MSTSANEEDEVLRAQVQELSDLFDQLCLIRHNDGQQEYGEFTFLDNDVIRMMIEELVDVANYARYQVIKLLLMNKQVLEEMNIPEMGAQAFKGTGTGWEKK